MDYIANRVEILRSSPEPGFNTNIVDWGHGLKTIIISKAGAASEPFSNLAGAGIVPEVNLREWVLVKPKSQGEKVVAEVSHYHPFSEKLLFTQSAWVAHRKMLRAIGEVRDFYWWHRYAQVTLHYSKTHSLENLHWSEICMTDSSD